MVYFVKACVFIASALSAINSSAAVRMPPRTFHESTVSEEEARVVSESTHKALYSLLPEETRRLQSANANQNAILNVKMTKEEKAHIRDYNKNNDGSAEHGFKPALVGVSKEVDDFVGKNPTRRLGQNNIYDDPFEDGVFYLTSEGFTWSIVVNSEDAEGISVLLSDLSIPAGVKISAFNEHGAFDTDIQDRVEDGQVWTKTIPGYEAFLVFHYAGDAPQEAIDNLRFSVDKVGIYNPNPVDDDARGRKLGNCNWGPAECTVDYKCCDPTSIDDTNSCDSQDSIFRNTHLTDLSNSHAKMKWWSGNWSYSCSAGLIENADGRALLLTANHCIRHSNSNLELFFSAKNNQCESNTNCSYDFTTADTIGMKTLASSAKSDFTLFEPNQPLPTNNAKTYVALGWNTDPVSIGEKLFRVHHPNAGPQSYMEQRVHSLTIENNYVYTKPTLGETMGGSSGSPIVNGDNEIVGQHYGWSDGNADWCSNGVYTYYAIDGEFASTYPMIEQFLGDGGVTSCTDGEPCDDGNACTQDDTCNSGTCAGQPIVCDISQTCQNGNCVENNVCSGLKKKECVGDCDWYQGSCILAWSM